MATSTASRNGPQPTSKTIHQASSFNLSSQENNQAQIDLAISLILHKWSVLATAVAHQWGGPESASKRDWLAGSVSDLFLANPTDTFEEDVEFRLLDVLESEFEINLEDDSEREIAGEICRVRRLCLQGDFEEVAKLRREWEERLKKKGELETIIQGPSGDNPEDDEDNEDEDEDEDGGVRIAEEMDLGMMDAPPLSAVKERPGPEVDEDGFTKVTSKKKR